MHQKCWGLAAIAFLAVATLYPVCPVAASQPAQSPGAASSLSPYWGPVVQQWEPIILEEALRRGLDPDLIAAVIWKESRGRPSVRGPAGAVGLMMVMPWEAGFSWRPTIEVLQNPEVNVFWGARALATVIHQSGGDLYSALAAYNGGWGQIHYRGPRRYAADILDTYARAVAMRHGLSPQGHWVATMTGMGGSGVMTVVGPQRSLTRYSRPPVMADIPDCTSEGPPTAIAYLPLDGWGLNSRVGIWILLDGEVIRNTQEQNPNSPGSPAARSGPTEA